MVTVERGVLVGVQTGSFGGKWVICGTEGSGGCGIVDDPADLGPDEVRCGVVGGLVDHQVVESAGDPCQAALFPGVLVAGATDTFGNISDRLRWNGAHRAAPLHTGLGPVLAITGLYGCDLNGVIGSVFGGQTEVRGLLKHR
jgi:hypothetical protein